MVGTTNRRTFLLVVASGTVGGTAGCLDEVNELVSDLEIVAMDANATSTGGVELVAEVENHGSSRQEAVLAGEVDIQGSETLTDSEEISVGAERSNTFTLSFSPSASDRLSGSEFTYDMWLE